MSNLPLVVLALHRVAQAINKRQPNCRKLPLTRCCGEVKLLPILRQEPIHRWLSRRYRLLPGRYPLLLDELIGVFCPCRQRHHLQFHPCLGGQTNCSLCRGPPSVITIKTQADIARQPLERPNMLLRHSSARRRYHRCFARLMATDHIHITLDKHRITLGANRLLGLHQAKDMPAFIIEQRLGCVEILGCIRHISNQARRKANHLPTRIHQRHHHPPTKEVAIVAVHQARLAQLRQRKAFFLKIRYQSMTIARRIANLKLLDNRLAQPPRPKHIRQCILAPHQTMLIKIRR